MKNSPDRGEDRSNGNSTPISLGRRSFVKSIAAIGAGLITSKALTGTTHAEENSGPARAKGTVGVVASDKSTVVPTTSGKVRGYRRDGVYVFKGLPYGASTGGAHRFMPPVKPEPWSGIRNALSYGHVCGMGQSSTDGGNRADQDEDIFLLHRGCGKVAAGEDCLRVNIWTPEINGSHHRPVMVYMHGGGFNWGSSQDLLSYEGENLARNQDVVVVNHNHRLNVLGYLDLAELGGGKYAQSANVGMLDIVAVLEWVRDNIENFGGDPGNVMIFGQSGGGGKVSALMAMPAAKGLFHRAVTQSGPYLTMNTPESSRRLAAALLQELGLNSARINELQTMPLERLGAAAAAMIKKFAQPWNILLPQRSPPIVWGPTVDGQLLVSNPYEPAALSLSAHIPLLTGTNLHEFVNGVDNPEAATFTEEELHHRLRATLGDKGETTIAAYRREYPTASPFNLYATVLSARERDNTFTQAARKAAFGAAPAYCYMFSWNTPMLDSRPGPFHGCEISFVMDNAELCDHYSGRTPEALALAKKVSQAWVAFARSGSPSHPGLPAWPIFTPNKGETMVFDKECAVRNNIETEGRRLISEA